MTATTRADAQQWFLPWSSARYSLSTKDGRPWGNGTHIAKRESATPPGDPWDEGCTVTPLIGGYETLCLIADTLEGALTQADADPDGHVYIADWRLNPLRDMSRTNPWKTGPWKATDAATLDQTVIGLILRLMAAGVKVRVLVWLPVSITRSFDLAPHIDEHWYLAQTVAAQAAHLGAQDRGIVAMDSRVADFITASHHQKMCVIRVGDIETAFVGGVDWAFTRRDAPADPTAAGVYQYDPDTLGDLTAPPPQFNAGDWQSGVPVTGKPGTGMPVALNVGGAPTHRWPDQAGVDYFAAGPGSPAGRAVTDLPVQVYGQTQQIWHDQHFRLAGPIVQTIEAQFCERWIDAGSTWDLGVFSSSHLTRDQVIFSKKDAAYDGNGIFPLPEPDPVDDDGGTSFVQMWRTIPLRSGRTEGTLSRGEFTIMAGISNAIKQSTQLIWLFDQYFFSRPLARQLNYQIKQNPNLHVVVVLPPFPDDHLLDLIHLRKLALNDLVADLDKPGGGYKRVAVYNTWHPDLHQGIYVHAKAKMFDDKLIAIGSGNLNRRSFTCDTELDCAVLDAGVLDLHQQRLWKCLFPAVPWPLIGGREDNWGKTVFDKFAATVPSSLPPTSGVFLIKDPWDTETHTSSQRTVSRHTSRGEQDFTQEVLTITVTPPTVPTQPPTPREQSYVGDYARPASVDRVELRGQKESESSFIDMNGLIEPSSLDLKVESSTSGKTGAPDPGAPGRLDEIVYLIEGVAGKDSTFPFRRR